ncbi:MAG: sulfurtransferase TusA family protein [Calditrichaeota bacterium]|nr:sulfurtransferase TusA family protein [Calditrichota bacterium]
MALVTIDCYGLLCPLPVIKASAEIKRMARGDELLVISTDPGAAQDLKDWCQANRQVYVDAEVRGRVWEIRLRKEI